MTCIFHTAKEGYFLLESSKSPYAGDVFHQPPLVLALLIPFLKLKNDMALWWFFIICDTFVALILRKICVHIVTREQKRVLLEEKKGIWHQPLSPLFQAHVLPDTVMMMYVSRCSIVLTLMMMMMMMMYSLVIDI